MKREKYESTLKSSIREAETWVTDGELEINHFTPESDSGKPGWYAYRYIDGYGSTPLEENSYSDEPLISDEDIEKYSIDVYKIFNECGVAYCG